VNFLDQENKSPLVLIVDDDHVTRMMAMEFLSQAGFTFAEADSGEQALALVKEIKPDLILLDVEMPGMDGFEVCTRLRSDSGLSATPILMLTGLNNNEAIDIAYERGATDFATKPINWSLLCHRLKYMHRASLAAEELVQSKAILSASQRIAELGNWSYKLSNKKMIWSDQLYSILGLNIDNNQPSFKLFFQFIHPEDQERVRSWLTKATSTIDSASIDFQLVPKSGSVRHVRQILEQVFDADGKLERIQATVQDFTVRRAAEQRIHQLAYYDELTGLANRTLFGETVKKVLEDPATNENQLAIVFFDLDDFKRVNDTFGHATGDKMIRAVGERLTSTLKEYENKADTGYQSSFIARMSGDEFTLLVNKLENREAIVKLAERIIQVFTHPIQVEGIELYTSLSIGSAIYPADGSTFDALLKNADIAMYDAKRAGKSNHRFHSHGRDAEIARYNKIDARMRFALKNDGFEIYYQPQLDLSTGKICSAEALLRWTDDETGIISPAEFIPIAEDNGLILELGEWVLNKACKQAKLWTDQNFDIQNVAVNVSVLQLLQAGLADLVKSTLQDTGLQSSQLKLEITESILAVDTTSAIRSLENLKQIGVKLSIDDFGTGYSSLSQLKNFPIDQLKIDQSFIRGLANNDKERAITLAIIAMANGMGIGVLAEGVETRENLEFLRENFCDEIQGYLLCKPLTAQDLESEMIKIHRLVQELYPVNHNGHLKKAG